jgi:hypothetical protein
MASGSAGTGQPLTCERSSQSHRAEISGLDVVEGVSADLRSVCVWQARPAVVIGVDDGAVLVAVVGLHRHGAWACVRLGGAGRDLRYAGVRDGRCRDGLR